MMQRRARVGSQTVEALSIAGTKNAVQKVPRLGARPHLPPVLGLRRRPRSSRGVNEPGGRLRAHAGARVDGKCLSLYVRRGAPGAGSRGDREENGDGTPAEAPAKSSGSSRPPSIEAPDAGAGCFCWSQASGSGAAEQNTRPEKSGGRARGYARLRCRSAPPRALALALARAAPLSRREASAFGARRASRDEAPPLS